MIDWETQINGPVSVLEVRERGREKEKGWTDTRLMGKKDIGIETSEAKRFAVKTTSWI